MTRNRQRCILPPLGAQTPASRIFRISASGTGSGFSRRIERVVRMISKRSVVPATSSAIASSSTTALNARPAKRLQVSNLAACLRRDETGVLDRIEPFNEVGRDDAFLVSISQRARSQLEVK